MWNEREYVTVDGRIYVVERLDDGHVVLSRDYVVCGTSWETPRFRDNVAHKARLLAGYPLEPTERLKEAA